MIDESAITQWRKQKPWDSIAQVEQDLLICRSLVAIYNDTFSRRSWPFAGGRPCTSCTFRLSRAIARTSTLCKSIPGLSRTFCFD